MLPIYSGIDVVQRVWLKARGERWHSVKELADHLALGRLEVEMVVRFLLRFGFMESRQGSAIRVRSNPLRPSPADAARVLRQYIPGRRWLAGC